MSFVALQITNSERGGNKSITRVRESFPRDGSIPRPPHTHQN